MNNKYEKLKNYISELGSAAVAFSGGVDSALLMFAAHEALGDRAMAVTADSDLFPNREHMEALELAKKYGMKHVVFEADEFQLEGFADNSPDRCYLCKKFIFGKIGEIARENGMSAVVEGSNMDDMGDYRPGMRAIGELGVLSPLKEAGLYKSEIRQLSRKFGLPTWEKPSFACLASRFAYGEKITREKLKMVEDGEQYLLDLGFRQVRVRIHEELARIELDAGEMEKFMTVEMTEMVNNKLKALGFKYVSLDLQGYRTGSMNETL